MRPQTIWPIGAKIRLSPPAGWPGRKARCPPRRRGRPSFARCQRCGFGLDLHRRKPCAQEPVRLRFSNELPYGEIKGIEVTPKPEWVAVTKGSYYHPAHSSSVADDSEEEGTRQRSKARSCPAAAIASASLVSSATSMSSAPGQAGGSHGGLCPRTFLGLSNERGILRRSTQRRPLA